MAKLIKILSIFFIASIVIPALGETKMLKAERTAAELGKAEPEIARMAEMLKGKNPDEAIGILRESTIPEKLWVRIEDEFPLSFEGSSLATLHKVVLKDGSIVEVGYSLTKNNVLEFYLNIPENLQRQGIFEEIFMKAQNEYSFNKIKGWWKVSNNYSTGESSNLTIFKQKIAEGLSAEQAALETPVGKIYNKNGYNKVEIIKNTNNEVIVNFYK